MLRPVLRTVLGLCLTSTFKDDEDLDGLPDSGGSPADDLTIVRDESGDLVVDEFGGYVHGE